MGPFYQSKYHYWYKPHVFEVFAYEDAYMLPSDSSDEELDWAYGSRYNPSVVVPPVEPPPVVPVDTDGDGVADTVDLDDDNDGVPDSIDAGPLNAGTRVSQDGSDYAYGYLGMSFLEAAGRRLPISSPDVLALAVPSNSTTRHIECYPMLVGYSSSANPRLAAPLENVPRNSPYVIRVFPAKQYLLYGHNPGTTEANDLSLKVYVTFRAISQVRRVQSVLNGVSGPEYLIPANTVVDVCFTHPISRNNGVPTGTLQTYNFSVIGDQNNDFGTLFTECYITSYRSNFLGGFKPSYLPITSVPAFGVLPLGSVSNNGPNVDNVPWSSSRFYNVTTAIPLTLSTTDNFGFQPTFVCAGGNLYASTREPSGSYPVGSALDNRASGPYVQLVVAPWIVVSGSNMMISLTGERLSTGVTQCNVFMLIVMIPTS